jgi:hypothetical protein
MATSNDVVVEGGVNSNQNLVNTLAQQVGADLLHEGRESRTFGRAVTARMVDMILGSQISDASANSMEANPGLSSGQIGAKIAQTTPPETAITAMLAQLQANSDQQTRNFQLLLETLKAAQK